MSTEIPQNLGMAGYKNPPVEMRFKPGADWRGNAGGKPKGTPNYAVVYQRLSALSDDEIAAFTPTSQAEHIVIAQLRRARGLESCKDPNAVAKEIADRVDGKSVNRRADVSADEAVNAARRDYELGRRYVLALNASLGEICCEGCAAKIQNVFAESDLIASILATTDERYREVVERELEAIAVTEE